MKPANQKQIEKQFFIKSYPYIWQVEDAIHTVQRDRKNLVQLSVLGKLAGECISTQGKLIKAKAELKKYWKGSMGPSSDFGIFCNPEMGTLFIAGALVSQFFQDLGGKALGEITSGPFGILRGLGIPEEKVAEHLAALDDKHYLLIFRNRNVPFKRTNRASDTSAYRWSK